MRAHVGLAQTGRCARRKYPHGESNPGYHLERVVSSPLDDAGATANLRFAR